MSFNAKVLIGVAGLIVIAALAIFLLSSSDEKVIQKLLESGLKAAEEGNADGVIALLSKNYKNGEQTYDGIVKRIRGAVSQRISPARMEGAAMQISGDDADVSVRVIVGALQLRQEFGLRLKLKKENGEWKVTSAEEVGH